MANTPRCRRCNADIVWHKSPRTGRWYPCNSENRRDFHSRDCQAAPTPAPVVVESVVVDDSPFGDRIEQEHYEDNMASIDAYMASEAPEVDTSEIGPGDDHPFAPVASAPAVGRLMDDQLAEAKPDDEEQLAALEAAETRSEESEVRDAYDPHDEHEDDDGSLRDPQPVSEIVTVIAPRDYSDITIDDLPF